MYLLDLCSCMGLGPELLKLRPCLAQDVCVQPIVHGWDVLKGSRPELRLHGVAVPAQLLGLSSRQGTRSVQSIQAALDRSIATDISTPQDRPACLNHAMPAGISDTSSMCRYMSMT